VGYFDRGIKMEPLIGAAEIVARAALFSDRAIGGKIPFPFSQVPEGPFVEIRKRPISQRQHFLASKPPFH
jgi:hypothetical protein